MKAPFRQQASEYDCVPTTFINAICYLFHRQEIPPFVVHRIYKECLDTQGSRGTSARAIEELAFWLKNYKEKRFKGFSVDSKYLSGRQVHLKESSKIRRCISNNGVALLSVVSSQNCTHYILAFGCDDEWLHCYDPHPHTKKYIKHEAVQFIDTSGNQQPNLLIRHDWLDKKFEKTNTPEERKYVLGDTDDRECLLLHRIHE